VHPLPHLLTQPTDQFIEVIDGGGRRLGATFLELLPPKAGAGNGLESLP
jgi:hypothetical protein